MVVPAGLAVLLTMGGGTGAGTGAAVVVATTAAGGGGGNSLGTTGCSGVMLTASGFMFVGTVMEVTVPIGGASGFVGAKTAPPVPSAE